MSDSYIKTLREAVEMAICNGPVYDIRERIHEAVEDFIISKFDDAYAKTRDEKTIKLLKELFADITA